MTRIALILVMGILGIGAASANAALPAGALSQLPGTAGCFTFDGHSEDGALTCGVGRGMARGESAIPSPDGRNVYVGSYAPLAPGSPGSLLVFSRDPDTGQLAQLPGTQGCFTPDGSSTAGPNTCTKARGLTSVVGDGRDLAITSDGLWAYVTAQRAGSATSGDILIFQRDPATGALTQLPATSGCISVDGSSQDGAATCQTDATLDEPAGISMSSDNRFVYVSDYGSTHRLHVYARGAGGGLTAIQCLSDATAPAGCSPARVLGSSQSLVIAPDGQHAYTTDYSFGISVFNRDPLTGLLTQKAGTAGCLSDDGLDDNSDSTCGTGRELAGSYALSISPDGHTLYDPTGNDPGMSIWHVNADGTLTQLAGTAGCVSSSGLDNNGAATCAAARNISSPYGSVITPDGRSLYVSNDAQVGGLAVFSLDPSTGQATQLPGLSGCVSTDGSADGVTGLCTNGRALSRGYGVSTSPDGRFVYQATDASTNAGLAIFARASAPTCSATSATVAHAKPTPIALSCSDPDGDPVTVSIVGAPGHGTLGAVSGSSVTYTPAASYSGPDSFTFAGSDGANTSAAATATLTVAKPFRGARLRGRVLTFDAKGHFKIKVTCPADAPGGRCVEVASLYSANGAIPRSAAKKRPKAVLLAKARFSVKAGKSVTKKMRLNKAGRKLGRVHQHFRARLRLRSTSGAGTAVRQTINVTFKRAQHRR